MDASVVAIIVQLIFLEGILSIDNAAVLGAMVAHLPNNRSIPWPQRLLFLGTWLNPLLGPQRQAALKVGLLGAYLGRGLMLLLAGILIHNPWVRIIGSAYLVHLAISHFATVYHAQRGEFFGHEVKAITRPAGGFWATVLAIELADLAFSVDNVIAAVALSQALWVVLLGVAIGIVIMRFAATIFSRMISWEPALQHGAYLLLFAIGAELLIEEFFGLHTGEFTQFGVSAGILFLTVAVARVPFLHWVPRMLHPLLVVFAVIEGIVQRIMLVLAAPFRRKRNSLP
ncbi:MAG TPA: tellurium resistance protein TerC [Roseiflexaceae bacterium]|nr:tellurium resistance protein TerC [Roseiflexaceae bacterium]HMP38821.1 tellurium resistance protein TerC [Roseiflexaceae bacterium]